MKSSLRFPMILLAALSLTVVAAGCKPADKTADKPAAPPTRTDRQGDPGLPTEKDQVSYMIGMAMAKQLEPAKDEIDVDVIAKAIKASLAGQKLLLTDQQAAEIAQTLRPEDAGQADRQDDGRCARRTSPPATPSSPQNAKKPGVQTTASGLQYQVITRRHGRQAAADRHGARELQGHAAATARRSTAPTIAASRRRSRSTRSFRAGRKASR